MSESKFYFIVLLLCAVFGGLCYASCLWVEQYAHLAHLLFVQILHTFGCFTLLGLGIGIPMLLVATLLGVGHIFLLLTGSVDPHLSKAGFFEAIHTLFNEF